MHLYPESCARARAPQGYDCFMWRRSITPLLRVLVGNLCIGYPPVGSVMNSALECAAGNGFGHHVVRGAHQTFHLGEKNGGWGLYREEYEGYKTRDQNNRRGICYKAR